MSFIPTCPVSSNLIRYVREIFIILESPNGYLDHRQRDGLVSIAYYCVRDHQSMTMADLEILQSLMPAYISIKNRQYIVDTWKSPVERLLNDQDYLSRMSQENLSCPFTCLTEPGFDSEFWELLTAADVYVCGIDNGRIRMDGTLSSEEFFVKLAALWSVDPQPPITESVRGFPLEEVKKLLGYSQTGSRTIREE